jgi:lysophospholipid acyltransferase
MQGSFICWSRVGFYGHIMIGVALAFFYGGGVKYLRSLQAQHGITPVKQVSTPTTEKPLVIPPNFDEIIPPPEK